MIRPAKRFYLFDQFRVDASERMLAALSSGISRSGLGMVGRSAGASETEIDRLVTKLEPVLLRKRLGVVAARCVQQAKGAVIANVSLRDFFGRLAVGRNDALLRTPLLNRLRQLFQ